MFITNIRKIRKIQADSEVDREIDTLKKLTNEFARGTETNVEKHSEE